MSTPPLLKGLHLITLQTESRKPFKTPCFLIAKTEYSEQVGINLQCFPKKGDKNIW